MSNISEKNLAIIKDHFDDFNEFAKGLEKEPSKAALFWNILNSKKYKISFNDFKEIVNYVCEAN